MSIKQKHITIMGGGLTGSLLALFLAKRDCEVTVYEWREDMRKSKIPAGRSINLAISKRGISALEEVGLKTQVMKEAIPMRNRAIHDLSGNIKLQPYGRDPSEHINAISRATLNIELIKAAEQTGKVNFLFEQKGVGADFANKKILVRDIQNETEQEIPFEVLFCTEGAPSQIRKDILNFYDDHQLVKDELGHSYKELYIPPGPENSYLIEKEALHIWPRGQYMLIALPNPGGSFTVTLFLPNEGEPSFETLQTKEDVRLLFEQKFPDALKLIENLEETFFANPTGSLATLYTYPWCVEDHTLMLGDAAHAIVPFFGQGMNACFEDVSKLMQAIDENPDYGLGTIFDNFQRKRKPDADAIGRMAVDNYYEMRDHVADPKFHLQKQIEQKLMEEFPGQYLSKYNMVTFNQVPYSYAYEVGIKQKKLLDRLTQNITRIDQLDWEYTKEQVRSFLETI